MSCSQGSYEILSDQYKHSGEIWAPYRIGYISFSRPYPAASNPFDINISTVPQKIVDKLAVETFVTLRHEVYKGDRAKVLG